MCKENERMETDREEKNEKEKIFSRVAVGPMVKS